MTRLLPVALLALYACAAAVTPPPAEPDPERARAALATLIVQNETTRNLEILYRTMGSATMVGIGNVAAGAVTELAPVPAAEPLVLIARTNTGAELVLPPRTFAIDGTWTWLIPRDAHFTRSGEEQAP